MNKKQFYTGLLLVAFIVLFSSVNAGNNLVFNDDYKISPKEVQTKGEAIQKTWEITYGESKRPVLVTLNETRNGMEYIVRNSYFEVKYVNGKNGFGIKQMKPSEIQVPENLCSQVLKIEGLASQKIISNTAIEESKVLDMIASFLPDLINDQYKNILN
ncbi:hypothetical protein ACUNWD_12105 [Sunxiuqinia sp. A32]|uniref:hypothetical protein n=1 Tax=Sunxiuqinia sp. A32 TaxID=3461496 RepID=UPI0040464A3F